MDLWGKTIEGSLDSTRLPITIGSLVSGQFKARSSDRGFIPNEAVGEILNALKGVTCAQFSSVCHQSHNKIWGRADVFFSNGTTGYLATG